MAFVLKQSETYTWPVTVEWPVDGGKTASAKFDAEFKRLSQSRIDELAAAAQSGSMTDGDIIRQLICGWAGVTDDDGDVPYSEKALAALLDITGVQKGILSSWFDSQAGAKRKN